MLRNLQQKGWSVMISELNAGGANIPFKVPMAAPVASAPLQKAAPDPEAKAAQPAAVAARQEMVSAEIAQNAQKMMQQVEAVVDQLNKLSINSARGLSFNMDMKSGVNTIVVTNTTTGEVVRTIPSDAALKVAQGIDNFKGLLAKFKGLLYDHQA
jgi:flagellar protein FlaG